MTPNPAGTANMELRNKGVPVTTPNKPNSPHARFFLKPDTKAPPIRADELAAMVRDFEEKGGKVQRLPDGFADGAIQTSYGKLLRS